MVFTKKLSQRSSTSEWSIGSKIQMACLFPICITCKNAFLSPFSQEEQVSQRKSAHRGTDHATQRVTLLCRLFSWTWAGLIVQVIYAGNQNTVISEYRLRSINLVIIAVLKNIFLRCRATISRVKTSEMRRLITSPALWIKRCTLYEYDLFLARAGARHRGYKTKQKNKNQRKEPRGSEL